VGRIPGCEAFRTNFAAASFDGGEGRLVLQLTGVQAPVFLQKAVRMPYLYNYDVNAATWFYLSLILIVAVFVRFTRVWSLRNLDLLLLLSISPGLLLVREGFDFGYVWLFAVTGLLLLRLFVDGLFERRPLLEQNMNVSGLAVLSISVFAFLMITAATKPPPASAVQTVRRAAHLLNREDASSTQDEHVETGPASPLIAAGVVLPSNAVASGNGSLTQQKGGTVLFAARLMAILAHFAVVIGLILFGRWHFDNVQVGLAMATLYLLLPCTSYDVGRANHVLPAALILWAFVAFRRPMVAGGLLGLACGTLFFPIFLLPLWAAFYGRRGAIRFGLALCIVAAVLLGSLVLTSADPDSFAKQTFGSIDWSVLTFHGSTAAGFWSTHDQAFRIPVFVGFLLMLVVLTIWPRKKNLEHLMAHSTALVVGTQFWYPHQGGVYLLWYLPLLLMVVFRPRLMNLLPPDLTTSQSEAKQASDPKPPELASTASTAGGHQFR
jgi:hypothetical protein